MDPIEPAEAVGAEEVRTGAEVGRRIAENIRRAVEVKDEVLTHVVVALLAEGHLLVED